MGHPGVATWDLRKGQGTSAGKDACEPKEAQEQAEDLRSSRNLCQSQTLRPELTLPKGRRRAPRW